MTGLKIAFVGSYLAAAGSATAITAREALYGAGHAGGFLAEQSAATLLGIALVISLMVGGGLTWFCLTIVRKVMERCITSTEKQIEVGHATQNLMVEVKGTMNRLANQMGACEKIHTFLLDNAARKN